MWNKISNFNFKNLYRFVWHKNWKTLGKKSNITSFGMEIKKESKGDIINSFYFSGA